MTTTPSQKPTVETFVDPERIAADVAPIARNFDGIGEELSRQASLTYYYSTLTAKAEKQLANLKLRLEAVEAQVATNVRTKAATDSEKLTADMVKERVRLHPKTIAFEQAIIEAQEVLSVLKGAFGAIKDKKDSLVAMSHMSREELRAAQSLEQEEHGSHGRQKGHLSSLRS